MAVRPRKLLCARHGERRRLRFETLEERRLLSLSHLYTFNDGLANDWIGAAHATLFNGATISGGQLVLNNSGVTSGQSGVVQHARLGANVLPSGDATVEVWFTAANSSAFTRVFDIGSSLAGVGNSYLSFNREDFAGNSQGLFRAAGASEIGVSGPALDDGTQHMAAIVIDTAADLMRLYFDGNEVGTNSLGGASAGDITDTLAYLGRSLFDVDPGFTGSINELRIYDDARSATDIAADAAAGPSNAMKSPLVRQMEYLDRGMVAVRRATTQAYVGWRLLGTDPADVAFNLYRSAAGGAADKLNGSPLTQTTDFVDSTANFAVANTYFVRPVIGGVEQDASESFTLAANTSVQYFLSVPLQPPPGATVQLPPGVAGDPGSHDYTYTVNDISVGDLDGDGQYEYIVKWDPFNPNDIDNPNNNPPRTGEGGSRDNSQAGFTGNVIVDAYQLDGTRLWRIDLGRNIRAGAHYTQFMVYDFDGDGRAEIAMKTAPGTIDGKGKFVLLGSDNPNADYRNSGGYILAGPEYLTVFEGLTGRELDTVPYVVPRHPTTQNPTGSQINDIWGDNYGNRVDRFLAGVAYLDGERPSLVTARGYYTRSTITAWDFHDGQLTQRWLFDTSGGGRGGNTAYMGQGTHSLSVADVDNDGKDEIIYGAAVIDEHGVGLHSTSLGHGDALHVTDMDPNRPGLEIFMPHEGTGGNGHIGASLRDARTGEILVSLPVTSTINQNGQVVWPDVGRGIALDIDPNHAGYEFWDSYHGSIFNSQGAAIYNKPGNMHTNFGVWWDADLLRETLDGTTISDWIYTTAGRMNYDLNPNQSDIQSAPGASSNNGSKSNPALSADIFGDWREEVIWRRSDNTALLIFTTPIAATNRLYTLMHDSQYREAIAWQNVGYNQPPHPSFFLGAGMAPPPVPQIFTVQAAPEQPGDYNGDSIVDTADYTVWRNAFGGTYDPNADGNGDQMIDEADYTVWKQNYGQSSSVTIVTNPPPAGAVSGQFASVLNEPGVQDAALTQPSLAAPWSSGEGSRSATGTNDLSGSAAVNQPAATARNHDLLFTLLDRQPSDGQANDVGSIDADNDTADNDTATVQDKLWAELDDVLPHADWLRL
jgi:hypothetical protein